MQDLIIRFLQGRATPEERRRVLDWRQVSVENDATFTELEQIWSVAGMADLLRPAERLPDPEALIRRAEEEERESSGPGSAEPRAPAARSPSTPRPGDGDARDRRARVLAAALAAVGFGVGLLVGGGADAGAPLAESVITTGAGEMTTVNLPDGSNVRIGPQTTIRFSEMGGDRIVALSGRAFFGVSSESSRRFIVRTPQGDATVFGTRFEVRSEDGDFRVLVVDGEVGVSLAETEEPETRLIAGQMSLSAAGGPLERSTISDVYEHLDWMGNALVLQATPLFRAAREIERRYGLDILIEDPELREVTVTSTFTGRSLDEVVMVLCEVVGARCLVEQDRVRIGVSP